jgi:hypothetical protein
MQYEEALLQQSSALKNLVLKTIGDNSEKVQEFLGEINSFFKLAHEEDRRLRKALAYLHGAVDSYKLQLTDNNLEPNEFYGREDGKSTRTEAQR